MGGRLPGMASGTVISGGFPGRVAQEVQPNHKCEGCLHYDGQGGRTGVCTIGERPWNCGTGDAQDVGYAPVSRGAGGYLPGMATTRGDSGEADTQFVSELYGSGSTRPVSVRQVSLGEEHVHLVKSMVARHAEFQKSQCRLCSMRGAHGTAPPNVGFQLCTCAPIEAGVVAKAIVGRMSNADRVGVDLDGVTEWVRDVAKAGFKLPAPRKARSLGDNPEGRMIDSQRRAELRGLNRPKKPNTSLADQVKIEGNGGHMMPMEKGTLYHPMGKYDVTPAGGGRQHVDFTPHTGGSSTRIGTFSSHGAARHAAVQHGERLASGTGGKVTPSTAAPTRKIKTPKMADAGSDNGSGGGLTKAIDNTKHSHIVEGKLAPNGVGYSSRSAARSAVDRLDLKHGAASHSVRSNPDYKPKTLKWEKTSAYGSGGHVAEAGHGTYVQSPDSSGHGHDMTYYPRGKGEAGAQHGGWHGTPVAAQAAAQEHHQKMVGG